MLTRVSPRKHVGLCVCRQTCDCGCVCERSSVGRTHTHTVTHTIRAHFYMMEIIEYIFYS